MLKYASYDILFQEVPGETTLAINLSRCPNGCVGCHSSDLQKDIGQELNKKVILDLLKKYQRSITCVCFMGGDNDPKKVEELALFIRLTSLYQLKTAWYSGKSQVPNTVSIKSFNYLKLGPYLEKFGPLNSPTSNQRFYKIENGKMEEQNHLFVKKRVLAIY